MTDGIKEQGGVGHYDANGEWVGLPGQAKPVRMVSTKLNADGWLPKPKPEGERVIGDPYRPRAHWEKEPVRMTPDQARADDNAQASV
jgi:hypothetical protein